MKTYTEISPGKWFVNETVGGGTNTFTLSLLTLGVDSRITLTLTSDLPEVTIEALERRRFRITLPDSPSPLTPTFTLSGGVLGVLRTFQILTTETLSGDLDGLRGRVDYLDDSLRRTNETLHETSTRIITDEGKLDDFKGAVEGRLRYLESITPITGDRGPKGDTGEMGHQGERGEKGDKGDPGQQGIQGATGLQGPAGSSANTDSVWMAIETLVNVVNAQARLLRLHDPPLLGQLRDITAIRDSVTGLFIKINY